MFTNEIFDFIENAYQKFNTLKYNRCYIDTDVKLSQGRLDTYNTLSLTDPFFFLAGSRNPKWITDKEHDLYQGIAQPPFITYIVGEYGNGKTELIIQASRYILSIHESNSSWNVLPLPINLAFCRNQLKYLNLTTKKSKLEKFHSFSKLIFEHLYQGSNQKLDLNFIEEQLVPQIQKGNIFFMLDGLDELLANRKKIRAEHKLFFEYLVNFLSFNLDNTNLDKEAKFKIALSMRLEYLWKICNADGKNLVNFFQNEFLASVYFLQTEFLIFKEIKKYIKKRLSQKDIKFTIKEIKILIELIESNVQLLDILKRPLYLKLFCDLLASLNRDRSLDDNSSFEELLKIDSPALLFEKFVDNISKQVYSSEVNFPIYQWNTDKLALEVLKRFQSGQNEEMKAEELSIFLDNTEEYKDIVKTGLELEKIKHGYIHKCPFLQKFSSDEFVFSHRAFLEFFVAKAISLEISNGDWQSFDEIVANVDMRKFLKYFAEKKLKNKSYEEITRQGNAMTLENEYRWGQVKHFKCDENNPIWREYEDHRVLLLNSMISPHEADKEIRESIEFILRQKNTIYIPSEYLSYAYEAIAVNLRHDTFDSIDIEKRINNDFSKNLRSKLKNHLEILTNLDQYGEIKELIKPNKELMLVERILDICRRLRYEWIVEFFSPIKKLINNFNNNPDVNEVSKRINALIKQMEDSSLVFY